MNLFVFYANDFKANAASHDDRTCIKLALECAQVLATASSHWGFSPALTSQGKPYKPTHASHPCTVWLTESKANYIWAIDYLASLLDEYERRFGKRSLHLDSACEHYLSQAKHAWPCTASAPADFAIAINDRYLQIMQADGIISADERASILQTKRGCAELAERCYRRYLRIAKCHYACWLHSEPPDFWLAEHCDCAVLFASGWRRFCIYKPLQLRTVDSQEQSTELSVWQLIDSICGRRTKLKQELMQKLIAEGEHAALVALYSYCQQ